MSEFDQFLSFLGLEDSSGRLRSFLRIMMYATIALQGLLIGLILFALMFGVCQAWGGCR